MQSPTTIGELFRASIRDIDEADARAICSSVLDISPLSLFTAADRQVPTNLVTALKSCIQRRIEGEPVAYILGTRSFYDLELNVNQHTLIPRPDTECLVEEALKYLTHQDHLLDLGTGSGAVGIALGVNSGCQLTLTDICSEALAVAKQNTEKYRLSAHFICSDWFQLIPDGSLFDIIVSNPPYIRDSDPHLSQSDLRFEPDRALCGGKSGLDHIEEIIREAPQFLNAGGRLMLEHGYDQADSVKEVFSEASFLEITLIHDLNGLPRVTHGALG